MQNFQDMQRNGIQDSDIYEFVNNPAVRKAKAVMGIVKGVMAVGMCTFALVSPLFKKLWSTDDEVFLMFSKGMQILLVLFIVMGAVMALRNLLMLILQFSGNDTTGAGHKYIIIMGALESNAGRVFQIVFGGMFAGFAYFAFTKGPGMLAEGNTVESLYIVSGIFILAGLGLIIGGIIGIVKSVKYYLSGEAV